METSPDGDVAAGSGAPLREAALGPGRVPEEGAHAPVVALYPPSPDGARRELVFSGSPAPCDARSSNWSPACTRGDVDLTAWLRDSLATERRVLADALWERHSAMQAELEWRLGPAELGRGAGMGARQRSPSGSSTSRSRSPPAQRDSHPGSRSGTEFARLTVPVRAVQRLTVPVRGRGSRDRSFSSSPARPDASPSPPPPPGPAPNAQAVVAAPFLRRTTRNRTRLLSAALGDEVPLPGSASPRSQSSKQATRKRSKQAASKEPPGARTPQSGSDHVVVCPRVPPPPLELGHIDDTADEPAAMTKTASSAVDPQEPEKPAELQKKRSAEVQRSSTSGVLAAISSGTLSKASTSMEHFMDNDFEWTYRLATHPKFELFFAKIIALNAVVIALEVQYNGLDVGLNLGYRWYERSAEEIWPMAESVFEVCHWVFGIAFTIELVLKSVGMRKYPRTYFRDKWNYFDVAVVVLFYIDSVGNTGVPTGVLRVIRMGRFLRLVKLVKTIEGFEALYLMTTALKGSLGALTWSCVLLVILQMLIALLVNQVLYSFYFDNDSYELEERQEIFAYFGTFSRSMLSMFEMTLANWPPICRMLQDNVNEWFVVFCVMHKLIIGFAVIGVINGVFIQETFKVASTDDNLMIYQKERAMRLHNQKMRRLFHAADETGDGLLDLEEFSNAMSDKDVMTWMASMELDVSDAASVFVLVDKDNDGTLTPEELVQGVALLKGAARSIDLHMLRREVESIRDLIAESVRRDAKEVANGEAPDQEVSAEKAMMATEPTTTSSLADVAFAATMSRRRRPSTAHNLFGTPVPTPKTDQGRAGRIPDASVARRWSLPLFNSRHEPDARGGDP